MASSLSSTCAICRLRLARQGPFQWKSSAMQVRGKKKNAKARTSIDVRLVKDVEGFGRTGRTNSPFFAAGLRLTVASNCRLNCPGTDWPDAKLLFPSAHGRLCPAERSTKTQESRIYCSTRCQLWSPKRGRCRGRDERCKNQSPKATSTTNKAAPASAYRFEFARGKDFETPSWKTPLT